MTYKCHRKDFINKSGSVFIATTLILSSLFAGFISKDIIKKISQRYGPFAARRALYLNNTLKDASTKSEIEKLQIVNDFWNEVRYGSDRKVWGKRDYWATPLQFLIKDRGDCEDYVIAKYFSLKYLGVDTKKLNFVYVKVRGRRVPHMVLAYYKTPNSEPLILDSINYKIFPASKRKDLIPIYTFNGDILKSFRDNNHKIKNFRKKNNFVKLKWDDLLNRIKRNVL